MFLALYGIVYTFAVFPAVLLAAHALRAGPDDDVGVLVRAQEDPHQHATVAATPTKESAIVQSASKFLVTR